MEKKQNQRVMLTKRLLKDSLIDMLKREDIYKVSIRDLCENAGINRSTFYKYYGSQFDLLKEMEDDLLAHIEQMLTSAPFQETTTLSQVFIYLEQNRELGRLLINNNIDPEFPNRLFNLPYIQNELFALLGSRYDAHRIDYIMRFVISGCFSMITDWINQDRHDPPQVMAELVLELVNKLV